MGSTKTSLIRVPRRGFTLLEVLTVIGVSSLLLALLASIFQTGLWEVSRSSGRIELVRNGRTTINQIQRILSYAVAPTGHFDGNGDLVNTPVYTPLPSDIYDPTQDEEERPQPSGSFRFFTPVDILSNDPPPTARAIQDTPQNFAYEIAQVPGSSDELGLSVVLRKLVDPISNSNDPLAIYPLDIDTSRQPRYLGRRLGIPDATAPTGYDDGLIIYRLRDSSFQINVNVSSALVTDELNRTHLENYTPLVIRMSSIYHPPIYSLD